MTRGTRQLRKRCAGTRQSKIAEDVDLAAEHQNGILFDQAGWTTFISLSGVSKGIVTETADSACAGMHIRLWGV
jgi:hypothetical protein